jgi:PAS domain S-box-containing protein
MSESHTKHPGPWAADHADGCALADRPDGISADVFVAALLRYASDAIAVSDRDSGRFVVVSDSYCLLTGYARDELIGRTSVELGLVADDAVRSEALDGADRELGAIRELRMRRKDGKIRLFEFSVQLLAGGLMLTISRDVTERRQIGQQLQESEERFRLMAENSTDVINRISPDGTWRYVSPSCRSLYGYEPEEMIGRSGWWKIHPEDEASVRDDAVAFMAGSDETATHRFRVRRKDGSYVWVESQARRLRDPESGETIEFQCATRDITERKAAEAEIQRAKDEAEAANRAKSEFLSRMSHELRTPLNAILGFGQLLERAPLDERPHRHAEHVVKGGRHLLTLIDEVLDISRIESGNISISVEPLLLTRAVEDTLELIRPLADHPGISIEADLSAIADVHVMADTQRLKQVLLNLLSNAVKYNRPDGSIRLSAAEEDETVVLGVSDTGPGIAAEDLPRLFTPFDRLGAEASDIEGTGLGLALSRGLAEAMGGSLNATSELGTGSTFELRLVRSEPQTLAPDRTASDKARKQVPACRVLYVEDNVSNLRLVEEILADDDVEIIAASTGRLALDIAPGASADVILLDINLPDMTGEEVLRGLRAHPHTATTPVIVLTADATPTTRRRMLELGVSAHLTKPIDIDLLKTTLADHTKHSHLQTN